MSYELLEDAQEPVASLLRRVWHADEPALRADGIAFAAFQRLLRWLADEQNPTALELVGTLGRLA